MRQTKRRTTKRRTKRRTKNRRSSMRSLRSKGKVTRSRKTKNKRKRTKHKLRGGSSEERAAKKLRKTLRKRSKREGRVPGYYPGGGGTTVGAHRDDLAARHLLDQTSDSSEPPDSSEPKIDRRVRGIHAGKPDESEEARSPDPWSTAYNEAVDPQVLATEQALARNKIEEEAAKKEGLSGGGWALIAVALVAASAAIAYVADPSFSPSVNDEVAKIL